MKNFLRKMVIAFGVLMLFLCIDIAVAWYFNPQAQTPAQAVKMEAAKAAAKIVATAMNAKIDKEQAAPPQEPAPAQPSDQPAQPDEQQPQQPSDTHLDHVDATGNILTYTITVKANGPEFDIVTGMLRSKLLPDGCTKPEYERLLIYGLGIRLHFRSQDGIRQTDISLTPESCGYLPIAPSQQ